MSNLFKTSQQVPVRADQRVGGRLEPLQQGEHQTQEASADRSNDNYSELETSNREVLSRYLQSGIPKITLVNTRRR